MASASNFKTLLLNFQTDIKAMALDGIEDASVVVRKFPSDRNLRFPSVQIYPQPERIAPHNNGQIRVGYGVGIVAVQASNEELEIDDDAQRLLRWRMRLFRRYSEHGSDTLGTGLTGLFQTTVEPGQPFVPLAFQQNYDSTALLVRCWIIEPDTQP